MQKNQYIFKYFFRTLVFSSPMLSRLRYVAFRNKLLYSWCCDVRDDIEIYIHSTHWQVLLYLFIMTMLCIYVAQLQSMDHLILMLHINQIEYVRKDEINTYNSITAARWRPRGVQIDLHSVCVCVYKLKIRIWLGTIYIILYYFELLYCCTIWLLVINFITASSFTDNLLLFNWFIWCENMQFVAQIVCTSVRYFIFVVEFFRFIFERQIYNI